MFFIILKFDTRFRSSRISFDNAVGEAAKEISFVTQVSLFSCQYGNAGGSTGNFVG